MVGLAKERRTNTAAEEEVGTRVKVGLLLLGW